MIRLRDWFYRHHVLSLILAGALAALALPPIGLWPVLGFTFPLLLLVLEGLPRPLWRRSFVSGWAFGFGYFIVAFHWIGYAFFVDAATYLWMMPFAVGGLSAAMAIYWGLAAAACTLVQLRGISLVFGFAAALGLGEYLRGQLFTGFPWAVPGLVVTAMGPLAQIAALVGMTGLTVLVVLWAGAPLLFRRGRMPLLVALLTLLLLPLGFGAGLWRLNQASDAMVPGVSLRIVQPNISQDVKWRDDNARTIFDQLKSLSAEPTPERPDGIASITHVVWPESAVSFLIDESDMAREELALLLGGRTRLITGALRLDRETLDATGQPTVHNSMIAFDGDASVAARYDKWRLVPGGEFLPFEWLLEPLGFRKVVTVPGSFGAGPGPVTIAGFGAPPLAMLVCYEIVFPERLVDVDHRPQWIVNVTNDGWFVGSTGPAQHLAQAQLRAIEQGIPIVRAANTGISAVIDSQGRVIKTLPEAMSGVIDSQLPVAISPPPYARVGDWALLILLFLCALISFSGYSCGRNLHVAE